ncbi:MAG: hypothetical protein Q8L24_00735 [bacterium]|nr:hypothetical protein [bacterium]
MQEFEGIYAMAEDDNLDEMDEEETKPSEDDNADLVLDDEDGEGEKEESLEKLKEEELSKEDEY